MVLHLVLHSLGQHSVEKASLSNVYHHFEVLLLPISINKHTKNIDTFSNMSYLVKSYKFSINSNNVTFVGKSLMYL